MQNYKKSETTHYLLEKTANFAISATLAGGGAANLAG